MKIDLFSSFQLFCIAYIVVGAWNLPRHRVREKEDNLISLTMIMFSALSGISNLVVLAGMGFVSILH